MMLISLLDGKLSTRWGFIFLVFNFQLIPVICVVCAVLHLYQQESTMKLHYYINVNILPPYVSFR